MKKDSVTPTEKAYSDLQTAFNHFNKRLFNDKLPDVMFIMRKHGKAFGYYHRGQWTKIAADKSRAPDNIDEICLNPVFFADRSTPEILSTLAHEMAHLWQCLFGKPPRASYHDKQFANKMKEIGLYPSNTGEPGGKETGQNMSHYIIEGGAFDLAEKALGLKIDFAKFDTPPGKKTAAKVKFECPACAQKAWGKPDLNILCGGCGVGMEAEEDDE